MATDPRSKKTTRPRTTRYEPVLQLPSLPYEQFTALKGNIAVNGVLVPILVDGDGPVRGIIDGNYRKRIADELGYDCPEIVKGGLTAEEKRTLARCLNLARRELTQQRRQLIADQLHETPDRSNRLLAKQLGVHHATVAAVRSSLEGTGQIIQFERTVGADGKSRPASKTPAPASHDSIGEADDPGHSPGSGGRPAEPDRKIKYDPKPTPAVFRTKAERQARIDATTLIHGDCRAELGKIPSQSVDATITDPIYPEVKREYGRIGAEQWHELMRAVVRESRRVLKPKGSMVVILQPNYEAIGRMRLWLWDFVAWAGREWNLVQDVYWWAIDAMPLAGTDRKYGLMRQSVKTCVWLGPPDCYRNQDEVLWTPSDSTSARHRADIALRAGRNGKHYRNSTIALAADERGGPGRLHRNLCTK